ncbi:hypothetical protein C8R46DRAFT_1044372 [Mycena filopes]|nr:hypothetical protein C8R46DRAFT_1044372 [Mycena filopes]
MSASGSRPKLELGECTALDEDTNEECTCTEFVEFKKTSLCGTCYHYRQNHLQPASKTSTNVQRILAGMLPSGSSSETTLGSINKARKQLTLTGSSALAKSKAANRESNRGMRSGREDGKGKAKAQETKDDRYFKVVSICILPCGTEFVDGERQIPSAYQTIPDHHAIQKAALKGLAVLRDNEGITLDRTWSHEEFVAAMHEYFPEAFAYFEGLFQESIDSYAEPQAVWHLGTISARRLKIVPVKFPTGANADYNKGAGTTGWRNNRLWIVSRNPIPTKITAQWAIPEALDFHDPATQAATAQSDDGESVSEQEEATSLEPTRRRSKRHAAASIDDDRQKKKQKNNGSYIDLTNTDDFPAGTSGPSTPLTPPPKPNPVNPKFSEEFKVDPSLGDPYAQKKKYTF